MALKRIQRLQAFKKQYGIKLDGSHEEGMRDLQTFQRAHAGFCLALGVVVVEDSDNDRHHHQQQHHVWSVHYNKLAARTLQSDESFAILMRGFFYCMQASQPNLQSMRSGLTVLADGHGVGWHNFSLKMEERAAALYANAYPARIQQIVMMHANLLLRLFWNLVKPFVSVKIRQRHVFTASRDEYLQNRCRHDLHANVLPTEWGGKCTPDDLMRTWSVKLQEG